MTRRIHWHGSRPPNASQSELIAEGSRRGVIRDGSHVSPHPGGGIRVGSPRKASKRRNPAGLKWTKRPGGGYVAGPWSIDPDGRNWVLSVPVGFVFAASQRTRPYPSLAAAKRGAAQEQIREASRRRTVGARRRSNAEIAKKTTKKKRTKAPPKKRTPKKKNAKTPKKRASRKKKTRR